MLLSIVVLVKPLRLLRPPKITGLLRLPELTMGHRGVDSRPTVKSIRVTSPLPEVSCWRNLDGTTPLLPMLDTVVLVGGFPMLDGVGLVVGMDFRPMLRPNP